MIHRCLPVFGLCFISVFSFAEAPSPQAVDEFRAAQKAMYELVSAADQMKALVAQPNPDIEYGKAFAESFIEIKKRLDDHLDKAIASGHAVAMYEKARFKFAENPLKGKAASCEFYGQAAEQGLIAGALEYVKCIPSYPHSEEYFRRLKILQAAISSQDSYESEYPLLTAFPYCFPKNKPALKPEEDAVQWIIDNAKPLALSSEEFRAEGYYVSAMYSGYQPEELRAEFLRSAFAHGCREDTARIAKHLGVVAPPIPVKTPPVESK